MMSPEGLYDVRGGRGSSVQVGLPGQRHRGAADIRDLWFEGGAGDEVGICGSARLNRSTKLWNHKHTWAYIILCNEYTQKLF